MAPSVNVKNISSKTTEEGLRKFFSFCGTVTDVDLQAGASNTQNATVFFEDKEAADTAAMLDETELDGVPLSVTRADSTPGSSSPKSPPAYGSESEVPQEHKPRRRILAEMLAQGYHITDQVIAKVLAVDKQRGFSTQLDKFLKDLENRIKPREQVQDIDSKYKISSQISNLANSWKTYLTPYVESASKSPTGTRLRDFYNSTIDSATQVHNEAMWIKKNQIQKQGCQCQCQCGSSAQGVCTCPPGKCKCAESEAGGSSTCQCDCPCDADGSSCNKGAGSSGETCACDSRKGTEKDCGCGTQGAACPCPDQACACANCPKQKKSSSCQDCNCQGDPSKCECPAEKCVCKSKGDKGDKGDKELYQ